MVIIFVSYKDVKKILLQAQTKPKNLGPKLSLNEHTDINDLMKYLIVIKEMIIIEVKVTVEIKVDMDDNLQLTD